MSNAMDKSFDNLRSKFDQFEAPVPEALWDAVAVGIGAPVHERSNRRWLWLLLLFLGTSLGFGTIYMIKSGAVVPEESALSVIKGKEVVAESTAEFKTEKVTLGSNENGSIQNDKSEKQTDDNSKNGFQAQKKGALETKGDDLNEHRSPITVEQEPEELVIMDDGQPEEQNANSTREKRIIALPGAEELSRPIANLQSLELPDYEWMSSPSFDQGGMTFIRRKKWVTRLNFGFQMNYSTINPNPNDDLFIEAKSHDFDLNTDRLGLTIGYDLWYHVNRRFWLKGQVFSHYRRFNIRLNYEENGDSAPREFRDQLNTLSLGMSIGVMYQLNPDEVSKSAFDVLISYENALVNEFKDTRLLSYPSGLWNLNLGYTFSPRTRGVSQWYIRPYLFYGLNRNFGDRAGEVRPFGFGFQFIRHR